MSGNGASVDHVLRSTVARAVAEGESCGPWSPDCTIHAGTPCDCLRTADVVIKNLSAAGFKVVRDAD